MAVAGFITFPKLYRMCQVKGWIPGGVVRIETITDVWHQTPDEHPKGNHAYWVSWGSRSIRVVGHHRMNLEKEHWARFRVGDQVQLVDIPGDPHPHTRDGIFVSSGNFGFDIVLLLVELAVAGVYIRKFFDEREQNASSGVSAV
jgi:hypothetical protein